MSKLRKAAVVMLLAFDGRSDIGMEAAVQQLREEVEVEREGSRQRTAKWRKTHPKGKVTPE